MFWMVLCDSNLCKKMEADFRQYYHADLRDVFDENSPMTVRWAIDMLDELPEDSRLMKEIRNDPLSLDQHMSLNIYDMLNQIFYQTALVASGTLEKQYTKANKNAPKPVTRPTIVQPVKEKPKFVTAKELLEAGMFKNS